MTIMKKEIQIFAKIFKKFLNRFFKAIDTDIFCINLICKKQLAGQNTHSECLQYGRSLTIDVTHKTRIS